MPPSNHDYIADIRNFALQIEEQLFETLRVASGAHSAKDLTSFANVTHALKAIFSTDSFYKTAASSGLNAQQAIAVTLERLVFELRTLHSSGELTGLFRPEIASCLRNFYNLLELLAVPTGGSARASLEFRAEAARLQEAIEHYSLQSAENSRVQEIHWRLEQSQKESGLLRAQLDSSQTELEIREERARSAELRAKQLDNQVSRLDAAFTELNQKVIGYTETELMLDRLVETANEEKAEITKIRDDAQTLAATAADNVMAANYGTMAIQHAQKEKFFRWAALLLFSISTIGASLIAWNVGWFGTPVTGESQIELWSGVAKKLLVAGGIAGIGLYFSRLASHHRKIEVWSSSLGVQLKTLESYLSGIKDEKLKDAIREKFADLTFGGPPKLHSSADKGPDAKALSELATAITTAIRP